jgi:hypothetical protein
VVGEDIDPESHDAEKDQKDQSDQRGDELGRSVGCRFGGLGNSKEIDKSFREEKEKFHRVQGRESRHPKADGSSFSLAEEMHPESRADIQLRDVPPGRLKRLAPVIKGAYT